MQELDSATLEVAPFRDFRGELFDSPDEKTGDDEHGRVNDVYRAFLDMLDVKFGLKHVYHPDSESSDYMIHASGAKPIPLFSSDEREWYDDCVEAFFSKYEELGDGEAIYVVAMAHYYQAPSDKIE